MIGTCIFMPRPEEAFEPVAFSPGHHMNVEMRHGLADAVVYGDKRALCLEPGLDRTTKALGVEHEGQKNFRRYFIKGGHMSAGNEEGVTRKKRGFVEERQGVLSLQNGSGSQEVLFDLAKDAGGVWHRGT